MAILDAQKGRKCLQELVCESVDLIQLAHDNSRRKYCVRGYEIWGLTKQEDIVAIYFSHGLHWASAFHMDYIELVPFTWIILS